MLKHIAFTLLARIDRVEGLENFPQRGAAILMINHIAFIDPVVVLRCVPRDIVPLAKAEVYRIPLWGIFPRIWGVIPVRREAIDRRALMQALAVLKAGEVILLAPEGTRNPSLRRGKEGVAYLGARSGAMIIPVAVLGTEGFPTLNPRRLRDSGAYVKFGLPFHFRESIKRPDRELLRKMTDEAMYQLATLLPVDRRGAYRKLEKATTDTISFA
jgi:1-acyl-sn-glycerol-3-phosphate acyltransferase